MTEAHADAPAWIDRALSWTGGMAGIAVALAAGLGAIWRHGYKAGVSAERARRRDAIIEGLGPHHWED